MGRGWGRAFCTTIPRDREGPTPGKCVKLGFLSGVGGSTPTTPRGQGLSVDSPGLQCKTNTSIQNGDSNSNILKMKSCSKSTPASPRSPFSILKSSFRLHKSSCGVCSQSIKSGQGTAIYTAECAHVFHFPCIASHIRKTGILICPVCKCTWKNAPFLAFHKTQSKQTLNEQKQIPESPKLTTTNLPNLKIKPYNDDEPLKSPGGMAGFIAIPEDKEDDVEEFQGFFANPIRSSSNEYGYVRNVEVGLLPEVALLSVGQSQATYVAVLKIKAPPALPAQILAAQAGKARRAPVDLVTVLDVSLSMDGAKLQMMKRAMRLVISSLGSADRLSILAFSASPKRLLPLTRMTPQGQRLARRIIDRLVTSPGSSLAEALSKATKVLEDRRERNPVASIMLLSDGQDEKVKSNGLNQRRGSSHESSTRFAHMEIPSNSAEDGFAKCVSGLLSVVIQDLKIEIGFGHGSDPGEISAVYSCNGRPMIFDSKCIRIGDLYAEEERELLVELRVPTPVVGSHHVLSVHCSYQEPFNQDLIDGPDQALLVPRSQAVRSSTQKIERLRSLFIATRAIAESRRLIEHDEMSSAHQLLASARALLMQSSSESAEEFVRGLEAELMEIQRRRQQMIQRKREVVLTDEDGEPLTPTSAWRAAEQLAKVARMKKSINRVSDLHGFENARF